MLLKKITLLATFVVALCSGAALPNATALDLRPEDASVQAFDFSVCGTAIAKAAIDIFTYSWNTGQAHLKVNAENCIRNLIGSNQCSTTKLRYRKSAAGDDNISRCFCAYSVGSDINVEDFLVDNTQPAQRMINTINGGTFTGAYNLEVDCGKSSSFSSIVVSCAGDSVEERVNLCKRGTWSPASQLISKAKTTLHLTTKDTGPAPCEIHPPYCNRTPPNNSTTAIKRR